MTECDLLIFSKSLKEKQEKMQICLTKIIDAINGLKQEGDVLAGIWEGDAKEHFMAVFTKRWEEAAENAGEMGKLVGTYSQIENNFENCEREIMKLL